MAQKTTKRDGPRKFVRPWAKSLPHGVRGWRRLLSIVGVIFLTVVVAAASIYSQPAETITPRSPAIDVVALVQSVTTAPAADTLTRDAELPVSTDETMSMSNPERLDVFSPSLLPRANQPDAAISRPIAPELVSALLTESIEATQIRLCGSTIDPRLQLVSTAPPYASSVPGSYETRLAYASGSIERSLFEAGQQVGLSDRQILTLVEIFGWDIDFALDVRAGDSFSAIYEEKYWLGRKIEDGPILAAEFVNGGHVYRAIGVRADSGQVRYYTPTGSGLKQTFLRTPVKFSRVSSGFSDARYHPILRLWRAHTGVDYAAPTGTVVRATAVGRIAAIGWNGGYGRTIIVEHGGAYSTVYAHLSRYRANLREGRRVEQGEVIGYVGSSGLATGPHLHYEFRVDGQHRDPLNYQASDSELIETTKHAEFLSTARVWAAELDRMSKRFLASR